MSTEQGLVQVVSRLFDCAMTSAGFKPPPLSERNTATKKMAAQLWEIGVMPPDVTPDQLADLSVHLYDKFVELGVEPLVYKSRTNYTDDARKFSHMEITFHDEVVTSWQRRSLAGYLNPKSKNRLPKRAVEIVHALQKAGLPLSASLEVLVPEGNTGADPILMVSFCDQINVLLCRWSNNVG